MKQWYRVTIIIVLVLIGSHITAQNTMRIHYKSGVTHDISITEVDSVTFIEKNETEGITLAGDWLWGSEEKECYEVLTFNDDRTYTGYDYYLEYGFDTWTYGTYIQIGMMLNLHTSEYTPDLILIYLGFNDFEYGVPVSCAPISNRGQTNLQYFEDTYHQMLTGLRYFYPNAKIVCATLMRTTLQENSMWVSPERLCGISLEEYNDTIRRAAANCHIDLADLAKCYINIPSLNKRDRRYETMDGTHPTAKGYQTIAEEWTYCLSKML